MKICDTETVHVPECALHDWPPAILGIFYFWVFRTLGNTFQIALNQTQISAYLPFFDGNNFKILLNQTEIGLYLPFFDGNNFEILLNQTDIRIIRLYLPCID